MKVESTDGSFHLVQSADSVVVGNHALYMGRVALSPSDQSAVLAAMEKAGRLVGHEAEKPMVLRVSEGRDLRDTQSQVTEVGAQWRQLAPDSREPVGDIPTINEAEFVGFLTDVRALVQYTRMTGPRRFEELVKMRSRYAPVVTTARPEFVTLAAD